MKQTYAFSSFLILLLDSLLIGHTSAGPCSGLLIPGIAKMGRGVDITELDLTPNDLQRANGFKRTIVSFTCDGALKWTTSDGTAYERPDQIAGANLLPAGQLRTSVDLSGDSEEYKRSRSLKVGLEVDTVKYGAYSASVGLKDVMENLYKHNKSVAETSATISSMQVDFKTARSLTLNEDFTKCLPSDPVMKYEENPTLYDGFIADYGTHYWSSAVFGGYLYLRTIIDETYLMNSDQKNITAELEASFMEKLKIKTEAEHVSSTVSDSFRKNSRSEFAYFGGTPVGGIGGEKPIGWLETWVPTVNKNPWLFAGKLSPIESLFAASNAQLATEVKKAVAVHMTKAYLKELNEIVRLGRFRLTSEQKATVKSVERKLKSSDPKDVQALVDELETIFKVVENLRDLAQLSQLKGIWEGKIPDIVECKTYIISACALHLRESNKKEVAPVIAFPAQIEAHLKQGSDLEAEDAKRILKEGSAMIAHQERQLELCAPGRYYNDCKGCIAKGARYAVRRESKPFCRSQESWKVIDHTPIFG